MKTVMKKTKVAIQGLSGLVFASVLTAQAGNFATPAMFDKSFSQYGTGVAPISAMLPNRQIIDGMLASMDSGKLSTDLGYALKNVNVVFDPQKNMIVAAMGDSQLSILRYLPDGRLDWMFGDNGLQTLIVENIEQISTLTLIEGDSGYQLLVAAHFYSPIDFKPLVKLVMFNSDGLLEWMTEVVIADAISPILVIDAPSESQTASGPVSFNLTFTDADTVSLTAEMVTLVTTNDVTGVVSVANGDTATPTVIVSSIAGNGEFSLLIAEGAATDTAGNLSLSGESAVVTVFNNHAPVISGTPAATVDQDAAYSFTPMATDQDVGDILTFSITNKPAWATFDSATGALTGIPTEADVGTYTSMVISVTDSHDATASLAEFAIEVMVVTTPTTPTPTPTPTTPAPTTPTPAPTTSSGSSGGSLSYYLLLMLGLVRLIRSSGGNR